MKLFKDKPCIKIHNFAQNSPEWKKFKAGVFSASNIESICKAKGLGATRQSLILEKFAEFCTGELQPIYSKAMQHGKDTEPIAKEIYSNAFGVDVIEVGCITNEKFSNALVSPDGIAIDIFENIYGIEIKCPETQKKHAEYITLSNPKILNKNELLKKINPQYYFQIQMCLMVTELPEWRFISYHEKFYRENEFDLRLIEIPIFPDYDAFTLIEERLTIANAELEYLKNSHIKKIS